MTQMKLSHRLRVAKEEFLSICQGIHFVWASLRSAPTAQKLNVLLCGVAMVLFALYGPKRPLTPQRILIPWENMPDSERFIEAGLVCFLLLSVGIMLYFLKLKQRFIYGMLEITFAMIASWKWYFPQGRTLPVMLEQGTLSDAIAASTIIYIVVRGLDNCYEYLKANKIKILKISSL